METLVWILQAVPHAIFITGLIVAGHWAIKKIIKAVKEYDNDLRFGVKLNENPIPSAMYEIDAGRSEFTFVSNIHEDSELVEKK